MQSGFTGHVTPVEWRWVLVVSIMLVGLAFLPFLWIAINHSAQSDWQFMGALHGHVDSAAYLSRLRQGIDGDLLVNFLHTPENHPQIILQPIYPILGQISRLASEHLSPILVYHVGRVSVTVFMYLALYQLAATIWMRVRSRRVFFVIVSVGSGIGWLVVALTSETSAINTPVDLTQSHIYPFFSGLVSIHEPLTISCLALLTAIIISAFRPGVRSVPTVRNSGLVAFMLGILLVFLYPEAYVILAIALVTTICAQWFFAKKISNRDVLWMMWILVPALPILIYYVLIVRTNPFVMQWIQQRASNTISPIQLVIGFGLMLLIGFPSIWRAVRRFESDGDRYMIIWLLIACMGVFLPIHIRSHFLVGAMIPVAYFATRGIEDFWLKYIPRRYRTIIFASLVPLFMISNLLVLLVPITVVSSPNPSESAGLFLAKDYRATLEWLNDRAEPTDVILASPEVSRWIPLWVGSHTVFAHPHETMAANDKHKFVNDWYQINSLDECDDTLNRIQGLKQRYSVRYVIYGKLEQRLGDAVCINRLTFVASFGSVEVYQIPIALPQ